MKKHDRELTTDEIATIRDEDIDFSDIPKLDEQFWNEAQFIQPDRTEQVTLRVKRSVLDFFKQSGKDYQTRINQVLESYVRAQEQQQSSSQP